MLMRYFSIFATAALAFSTTVATAQTRMSITNVRSIVKTLLCGGVAKAEDNGGSFANMNSATTKPTHISDYVYQDNAWKFSSTTKTEYNQKGYVTATETTGTEGTSRVEYTYDDSLDGFVTKTTNYSWDEASKSWTNPIVTSQIELTKNDKGRVTKETVYTYDEDTKKLEKEMELDFEYALISGKLYKISTTIEEEGDNGENISIPVSVTIQKWHKYNENKLFNFSLDNMESFLSDSDNQIESATLTLTMPIMGMNLPINGTVKGTYEDTKTNIEVNMSALGQSMMKMVMTANITDQYGSSETDISMDSMGQNVLTAKTVSTNNEHGDCIKTETSGTVSEDLGDITGGESADISADDLNQSITYDYEYYTLPDNSVLKKSMTTNVKDKTTNEYKPTTKTDYWGYIDYVFGTTGIESMTQNSNKTQNKAIYGINGEEMKNIPSNTEKRVYILKEGERTIKIAK